MLRRPSASGYRKRALLPIPGRRTLIPPQTLRPIRRIGQAATTPVRRDRERWVILALEPLVCHAPAPTVSREQAAAVPRYGRSADGGEGAGAGVAPGSSRPRTPTRPTATAALRARRVGRGRAARGPRRLGIDATGAPRRPRARASGALPAPRGPRAASPPCDEAKLGAGIITWRMHPVPRARYRGRVVRRSGADPPPLRGRRTEKAPRKWLTVLVAMALMLPMMLASSGTGPRPSLRRTARAASRPTRGRLSASPRPWPTPGSTTVAAASASESGRSVKEKERAWRRPQAAAAGVFILPYLYPTPQPIVFHASSHGSGYHASRSVLATIYARSRIRTSENLPSKQSGE